MKGVQYFPLAIRESFLPNTVLRHRMWLCGLREKKNCPLNPLTPSLWVLTPEVIAPQKKKQKKKSDPRRASGLQLASETGLTRAIQESAESQDHSVVFETATKYRILDSFVDYAAKSLQSCPTLCDPIDSSSPGSPIPGILQARTLEWVTLSFSNA